VYPRVSQARRTGKADRESLRVREDLGGVRFPLPLPLFACENEQVNFFLQHNALCGFCHLLMTDGGVLPGCYKPGGRSEGWFERINKKCTHRDSNAGVRKNEHQHLGREPLHQQCFANFFPSWYIFSPPGCKGIFELAGKPMAVQTTYLPVG